MRFSFESNVLHAVHVRTRLNPLFGQNQACNAASNDAACGFSGRRSSTATVVSNAVLGVVGEVGMGGAKGRFDVVVIGRVLVGISNQKADRRAGCLAFENATQPFNAILFFSTGRQC